MAFALVIRPKEVVRAGANYGISSLHFFAFEGGGRGTIKNEMFIAMACWSGKKMATALG